MGRFVKGILGKWCYDYEALNVPVISFKCHVQQNPKSKELPGKILERKIKGVLRYKIDTTYLKEPCSSSYFLDPLKSLLIM